MKIFISLATLVTQFSAQALDVPALPVPVANNAVAAISDGDQCKIFSMGGIGGSLTSSEITNNAYKYSSDTGAWNTIASIPLKQPVVAASAVELGGTILFLGCFSVAENGAERTSEKMFQYDENRDRWNELASPRIPVDDSVLYTFEDRFLVTVSGWSNRGNVSAVQLYDLQNDSWAQLPDFPGIPVFGATGSWYQNKLLLLDGVAQGNLGFQLIEQTWVGEFDSSNLANPITWKKLPETGRAKRYRAAGGRMTQPILKIFGGGLDAYNYDGLSYATEKPVEPASKYLSLVGETELSFSKPVAPSMDHRGIANCGGNAFVVGGLNAIPMPLARVLKLPGVW